MGVIEEVRALRDVVDRLAEKYPAVSRKHIEDIVEQEHRLTPAGCGTTSQFLVEHAVGDRLRQ